MIHSLSKQQHAPDRRFQFHVDIHREGLKCLLVRDGCRIPYSPYFCNRSKSNLDSVSETTRSPVLPPDTAASRTRDSVCTPRRSSPAQHATSWHCLPIPMM